MASFAYTNTINNTFIFIDGSYFCFYRYHSLLTWWKNAYPEVVIDDPFLNEQFVAKFRKTFVDHVQNLKKNLGIPKHVKPTIIVGRDCKRENIWRNELFPNYKATRANGKEDGFMGGPFFKMVYADNLFIEGGASTILYHPKLEADDCIALSVKHVLQKYQDCNVYIITSDKDYLQLAEPRVHIYNLGFKKITDQKSSTGSAECDLFCKIVMGDISDNGAGVNLGSPVTGDNCTVASVTNNAPSQFPVGLTTVTWTVTDAGALIRRGEPLARLSVPARGSVTLAPGGTHLMLIGVHEALVAGQTVPVELRFEKAGTTTVTMPVQARKTAP